MNILFCVLCFVVFSWVKINTTHQWSLLISIFSWMKMRILLSSQKFLGKALFMSLITMAFGGWTVVRCSVGEVSELQRHPICTSSQSLRWAWATCLLFLPCHFSFWKFWPVHGISSAFCLDVYLTYDSGHKKFTDWMLHTKSTRSNGCVRPWPVPCSSPWWRQNR